MLCPKCNREGVSETECSFCGVIYSKYRERPKAEQNHPGPPRKQTGGYSDTLADRGMEWSNPTESHFKKQAATASWVIVLITFGVMHLTRSSMEGLGDIGAMMLGGFIIVLYIVGIILGLIGMTGVKQFGARASLIPGLAGTLLNGIFLFLFLSVAISSYTNYSEKIIVKASENINKQLPRMIDKETRLDRTTVGPGKRFSYMYTLINYGSSEINGGDLKEKLAAKIRESACAETKLRLFFKKGVTLFYIYNGNDGAVAFEIPVSPSDCGFN